MSVDSATVRVIAMTAEHVDAVVALEARINPWPWSADLFLNDLADPETNVYLVTVDSSGAAPAVVGYCGAMRMVDEAHITVVGVEPGHRRRGIATALVGAVLAELGRRGLADTTLEVRVSNTGAIDLYRSFGFRDEGIRPGYFHNPDEDGLIMWRRGVG